MSPKDILAEAARNPDDWFIVKDDFEGGASDVPNAHIWEIVKDSGATVAIDSDADKGTVTITSAATTDNDGGLLQSINEMFAASSGKRIAVEARVKVSDADQSDFFFGLSEKVATNPENILTASNRVGFQSDDGDAALLCKSEKSDVETSKSAEQDLADATYVKLGICYDGDKWHFYVDDNGVATISSDNPTANLALALCSLSGDATGTKTCTADFIRACSER